MCITTNLLQSCGCGTKYIFQHIPIRQCLRDSNSRLVSLKNKKKKKKKKTSYTF